MDHVFGDIWHFWDKGHYIVIPTNGFVKRNGACVMGRGLAKDAMNRFPSLPIELGAVIERDGNCVHAFPRYRLFTFPVKRNWWDIADIVLIKISLYDLKDLVKVCVDADAISLPVYVPRVGCGNGRLEWEHVKPILDNGLDNRFAICSLGNLPKV
jgi:hypothetical protein